MRKKWVRSKVLSAALVASLTATSIAGNGIAFPLKDAKAASDEGAARVQYKGSNYYNSEYDSKNAYSGNDLGCNYTKEETTFKVWSPEASAVVLCRYATGSDKEANAENLGTVAMTKGDKGVWSCTVKGDIVNTYYTYKVTVNNQTKEAVDIYAKATGVNGDRAMVVDLDSTDPEGWDTNYQREKTQLSDINVWEIHIRDFSIDVSSGVSEANRGKYKAFTEHTTVNGKGKVASCVDYLKELGVTHVQLLPMYDYGSTNSDNYCVDERNVSTSLSSNYNWGYDPENYNVPEGSYSSNPYDGNVRISEMKEMIQALHDAGIKVIMDVVYNHTYDSANSNFNKIMPDYYYKVNSDGSYNDQSGCGNATRSQSAMYRKFMIDSVSYWAEEYNIDGFRFDLMGIHDVTTMNQIRSTLDAKFGEDTIVMYGEGWTATSPESDGAWKGNEDILDDGIGFFNDQIRDSIKGDKEYNGTIGYVQTNYQSGSYLEPGQKWPNNLFGGIMGSVGESSGEWKMWRPFWSKSSNCSLNYTSAHDDLTLWDKFFQTGNGTYNNDFDSTDDQYIRMNKMSGAIINISKGGTFMQAGEEFCRSKYGVKNSYSSPDSVNKLDWTRLLTHGTVADYYKGMLQIRHVFSGFTKITTRNGDNWNPNGNNYTWEAKDESGVSTLIVTNDVANEWNKVAVIMNNKTADATVDLGRYGDSWVVISDGNKAGIEAISECGSNVVASGKSVVVAVPKDTYDKNIEAVRKKLEERQNLNSAPTISIDTDSTIEVEPNSKVTIQVSAKDADGDKVTLSASDLPEGAEFDADTGVFTWNSAVKGTYTVTFTATDGTAKTSKTVTIEVSTASASLEDLVAEIEAAELSEDDFTEQVFHNLQTALDNAKEVIGQSESSEETYKNAYNALQNAYDKVKEEKTARENLATYVATAKKEIENADSSVDTDLLKDAKEVLQEAETLLSGTAKAMAYTFAQDNLTDSVNALAMEVESGIHVSTSFTNPHIYIWTGTGNSATEFTGEWPGTALTEKDSDGNYFYELPSVDSYNIVINDGKDSKKQTQDMTADKGSILITVADSSSSTSGGNSIYTGKVEKVSDGGSAPEITKESLNAVIEAAKKYDSEDYTEDSYEALETQITEAEKVAGDNDATQLIINQQARALRAAILSLVAVKEDVMEPTVSPTETTAPPEKTDEPTETPNTDATSVPGTTDDAGKSPTPSASVKPSQTPDSSSEPSQTSSVTETTSPQSTASLTPGTNVPGNVNTPTDSAVQVSDLKIKSVSCNPVLCQVVKKNVKISVAAEGGIGSQQYKFEIYKGSKLVLSSEYSDSKTFVYKASSAGTYTFKVYVKDENNVEVSKTKKFIFVSKALSLKISKRVAKKKVTLKASASGGLKSYKYKYVIKNAKGKTVKKTGFVSKKKLIWRPTKKGTYKVTITVKDSTGTTKSKTITVKKK